MKVVKNRPGIWHRVKTLFSVTVVDLCLLTDHDNRSVLTSVVCQSCANGAGAAPPLFKELGCEGSVGRIGSIVHAGTLFGHRVSIIKPLNSTGMQELFFDQF